MLLLMTKRSILTAKSGRFVLEPTNSYLSLYQLHNFQALLNLRRGYSRNDGRKALHPDVSLDEVLSVACMPVHA